MEGSPRFLYRQRIPTRITEGRCSLHPLASLTIHAGFFLDALTNLKATRSVPHLHCSSKPKLTMNQVISGIDAALLGSTFVVLEIHSLRGLKDGAFHSNSPELGRVEPWTIPPNLLVLMVFNHRSRSTYHLFARPIGQVPRGANHGCRSLVADSLR